MPDPTIQQPQNTPDQAEPDLEQLAREVFELLLRELELERERNGKV